MTGEEGQRRVRDAGAIDIESVRELYFEARAWETCVQGARRAIQ